LRGGIAAGEHRHPISQLAPRDLIVERGVILPLAGGLFIARDDEIVEQACPNRFEPELGHLFVITDEAVYGQPDTTGTQFLDRFETGASLGINSLRASTDQHVERKYRAVKVSRIDLLQPGAQASRIGRLMRIAE
jgi:hypothetical protein